MELKKLMLNSNLLRKVLVISGVIAAAYSLRSLTNLFLLTFFLTFIFYNTQKFIFRILYKFIPAVNRKEIAVIVYILIFSFFAIVLYIYTPMAIKQLLVITHHMYKFDLNNFKGKLDDRIINSISKINIQGYIGSSSTNIIKSLSEIGGWGFDIIISLILSFMFIIEKEEIQKFMIKFRVSRIGFMYESTAYYGRMFLNSFGKIMRIQMITAGLSAAVTLVWLTLIGFHQALGFAIMMLILTLVPVIGALICLVPLSLAAFKMGGIMKLVNVLIMILVLHILESYVIKPKLMAMEIRIPMFVTFIILVVSEHFMGVWGLLLGLPLFTFLIDILGLGLWQDENHVLK